jgi:hypothetical protein
MTGSYVHGSAPSSSINGGEFHDWLSVLLASQEGLCSMESGGSGWLWIQSPSSAIRTFETTNIMTELLALLSYSGALFERCRIRTSVVLPSVLTDVFHACTPFLQAKAGVVYWNMSQTFYLSCPYLLIILDHPPVSFDAICNLYIWNNM